MVWFRVQFGKNMHEYIFQRRSVIRIIILMNVCNKLGSGKKAKCHKWVYNYRIEYNVRVYTANSIKVVPQKP
jgi:hypothetical protein